MDFGVSRHPENRVRAVRGRWVGRGWGYGSAAPGGPGACLGLPPVRFWGRWHRLVGRGGPAKTAGRPVDPFWRKFGVAENRSKIDKMVEKGGRATEIGVGGSFPGFYGSRAFF